MKLKERVEVDGRSLEVSEYLYLNILCLYLSNFILHIVPQIRKHENLV